jgi:hypothetical protein
MREYHGINTIEDIQALSIRGNLNAFGVYGHANSQM